MKKLNGEIIQDSDHRISHADRMKVLYDVYRDSLPRYKKYYEAEKYNMAKMVASVLGQPLYDATKSGRHSTGYFTTGAVDNQLRPEEASVEHPYGRTDAAIEIYNESLRQDRKLKSIEFCEMVEQLCFTVRATREENQNLSILSREDRSESWINVYNKAGVDLFEVPVEKVGRKKVYHFDNAEKIDWSVIKEELAH